jgi:hypothetical protein
VNEESLFDFEGRIITRLAHPCRGNSDPCRVIASFQNHAAWNQRHLFSRAAVEIAAAQLNQAGFVIPAPARDYHK